MKHTIPYCYHVLSKIYTAHYSYKGSDRVDITVKGQDPLWWSFAPTWEMVMGIKKNVLSEEDYTRKYKQSILRVPIQTWDKLLKLEEATFVCFCSKDSFCHRNLLVDYMVEVLGDRIEYCGWRE